MSDDADSSGAGDGSDSGGADDGSDARDDGRGFSEGLESSKGDPRLLIVLNLLLSTLLAWSIVGGMSLIDAMEFSAVNVATLALILFAMTYVVTQQ